MPRLRGLSQASRDHQLERAAVVFAPGLLQVVLDHGANPNHHVKGEPFLLFAVQQPNIQPSTVLELIQAGAEPRIPGLLQRAVRGRAAAGVLRVLLKAGADPHGVDKDGHTAMDYARELKNDAALALLEEAAKAAPVSPVE